MELKSAKLQQELEQEIAKKRAEIAAAIQEERKDVLEDIRAKCKLFGISHRELKAHLVRVPGAKKKTKKTRTRSKKSEVSSKQSSATKQTI
jgi:H-NS histone family